MLRLPLFSLIFLQRVLNKEEKSFMDNPLKVSENSYKKMLQEKILKKYFQKILQDFIIKISNICVSKKQEGRLEKKMEFPP